MKITEYIPLEYKIKIVNMVEEHPKWSLKKYAKERKLTLEKYDALIGMERDIKHGGTSTNMYTVIDSWTTLKHHTWLVCFKQRRKIWQQKITKYVTAREFLTIENTPAAADMYRKQTLVLIPQFNKDFIINTDQIGKY